MPIERFDSPRRGGPLGPLWELLFPARCLGCGERRVILCSACAPTIPWLSATVCPRCARDSREGGLCPACRRGGHALASARAACGFDGVARTAIHALKYRHARFLSAFLGRVLAEAVAVRPLEADLVVPVPLGPNRWRERGYNQSELIAGELARLTSLPPPTPGALAKPRDTRAQVGLSAAERRANLRGAFRCPTPALVAGRRCLVIDDVMTTGATLEACAESLRRAGATRVMGLVVARD